MTRILLTGAGFSRNWGGWLATEAFEYLLGCPEIDAELRNRLWQSKSTGGGFEDLLADLQEEHARSKNARSEKPLKNLEAALYGMFQDMDLGFVSASLNTGDSRYHLRHFLVQFDAIFTLNQDLLLERHYLNGNIELSNARKWIGWQMPGLKFVNPTPHTYSTFDTLAMRKPDPTLFKEEGGLQPYFKLHGSSNWVGDNGERLLVMGGNKAVAIRQQPLLQ